jgi:hypothetical protein
LQMAEDGRVEVKDEVGRRRRRREEARRGGEEGAEARRLKNRQWGKICNEINNMRYTIFDLGKQPHKPCFTLVFF